MKKADLFPEKPIVFISYRQETSSDFVGRLYDRLKKKYKVHYDRDQDHESPGKVWTNLEKDINECTHFILVVDEKTFTFDEDKEKDFVWKEINHVSSVFKKKNNESDNEKEKIGEDKNVKIIPILLNGNKLPKDDVLKSEGFNPLIDIYTYKYKYSDDFDYFFNDFLSKAFGYNRKLAIIKKILGISLLAIVAAALLLLGGTLLQQWISSRTPKLVFAGGGSVKNVIKAMTNEDIKKYKNSLYLDLPSQNAWALLAEEVMINHTSDTVENKFYPVCLSALKAPDSVFYKIVGEKKFLENGTIISYRLRDDTLKIYTNQDIGEKGIISISDLSSKIKKWCQDKSVLIYITQEGSGTYFIYEDLFKDSVEFNSYKNQFQWYGEQLKEKKLNEQDNNQPYIVLSSQYYTPQDIHGSKAKALFVVDKNGNYIAKPMYLYFAGYTNSGSAFVRIPEVMVKFIKLFDKDAIIKSQMHQDSELVVTSLDSLKIWERNYQNRPSIK